MSELDPIIHQPLRLKILAALSALRHGEQMDFVWLKKVVSATDGNLGSHLTKLEDAGYVEIEKTFSGKKPRTLISASDKGRAALRAHVDALKRLIEAVDRRQQEKE